MNRIALFIFSGIILTTFFSCSTKPSTESIEDPNTEKFSSYLMRNFEDSIPFENHLFILITAKDSPQNIIPILSRLKNEMSGIPKTKYTMIFSSAIQLPDSLKPKSGSYTDWNLEIDKLDLNLAGVSIIKTSNNRIQEQLVLDKDVFGMEKKILSW